jgi:glycerate-2-kinase
MQVHRWPDPLESDVESAARFLAARAEALVPGELLVAGGEPTVVRAGNGRGGRCSELAVRFALHAPQGCRALFASSDGLDGNSGVAGFELDSIPLTPDRDTMATELADSNSFVVASALGRAIMIPPAGNNLRDLYLLARG